MRVIFRPARDQLASQSRILVDFKHVHADVRHFRSDCLSHGNLPTVDGLMRQARNQVNIDILNSRGPQARNVVKHSLACVQSADRGCFLIYKRLHAETHPIYAAPH